ncbi:ly-6/neurotoxin-like protein 1 [Protopterus annectens]|uniref:ly-6/neurotoxin-like protein 1 n=1 Tax=Protopterus annectens TaxID=7888 RepID=UPI001CF930C1|nr:ly-6/neurotoxin-like protein 1 [Protopterus annectens]
MKVTLIALCFIILMVNQADSLNCRVCASKPGETCKFPILTCSFQSSHCYTRKFNAPSRYGEVKGCMSPDDCSSRHFFDQMYNSQTTCCNWDACN